MNDDAMLREAFRTQADCYARAAELAAALAAACEAGAPLDDRLSRVLALLDEAAAHAARVAPVRQRWEQAGRPAGPELRAAADRAAALVGELGRHLRTIEAAARGHRDRLAGELDACNSRRQMQRAYLGKS